MFKRARIVTVAKWVFWPLLILVGLNLEKLAEALGWDSLLARNWNPIVRSVFEFFQSWSVQAPGILLLGLAAGIWLDNALRKKEVGSFSTPTKEIDLAAVADRAEELAKEISMLLGDHAGRSNTAWHDDSRAMNAGTMTPSASGIKQAEVEARLTERYGEKYAVEVLNVVLAANTVLDLEGELWKSSPQCP